MFVNEIMCALRKQSAFIFCQSILFSIQEKAIRLYQHGIFPCKVLYVLILLTQFKTINRL
ncbi:hypothetical protein U27_02082 [Candidatus Vecturithrix granuli]|uniref:Uncharacterized protein n=1 Tax=Vecturithrix granuli TaxID=1499967 RepID=A0A0S6W9U5_VECG1|nr:hypothetical protein U27_02082 [Candidatus Vecturithrix granuli]